MNEPLPHRIGNTVTLVCITVILGFSLGFCIASASVRPITCRVYNPHNNVHMETYDGRIRTLR